MNSKLLIVILAFVCLASSQISAACPVCDFTFVRNTYPNPDLYFQKNAEGVYKLYGRKDYNDTSHKNMTGHGYFDIYLKKNVVDFQTNRMSQYNCVPVNLTNVESVYPQIPLDEFELDFGSRAHACVVPNNTVLVSRRSRIVIGDIDTVKLTNWSIYIKTVENIQPHQYRRLLLKMKRQVLAEMNRYKLQSFIIRANANEPTDWVQGVIKRHIEAQLEQGIYTPATLPTKFQCKERQHVKLLPPGTKFMPGRFFGDYNPNVLILHSPYQVNTECKFY